MRKQPRRSLGLGWGGPVLLALLSSLLLYWSSPGSGGHGLLAWIALVPLLLAIRGRGWRPAALLGLLAGLGYHLPLLHWITIVLGEYGGVHPLVAMAALILLAIYMSLYPALFAALLSRLTTWGDQSGLESGRPAANQALPAERPSRPMVAPRLGLLWAAPVIWVGLDVVRARLFTGFPWQDLGYSQYSFPLVIQMADLAGHHGITFAIVLANSLLAGLLCHFWPPSWAPRSATPDRRTPASPPPRASCPGSPSRWTSRASMLGAVLLLGALALYGPLRLQQIETMAARTPTMKVSIIQGNIPQEDKWEFDQQTATIELYLDLSGQAAAAGPELIVWPETALPFYPLGHPLYRPVASFPFQHDLCLLAGAPHRELDEKGLVRYYNSALLIAPDEPEGRLAGIYHKQHLVPFGEYIPLRRLLPFFAPVVETLGDFSPGTSPYPLACGERRLGILICFEAIFPRLARQVTVNGADLLINITNDAWFGPSNAPWQHLSMAALRAVENRRSLARAANTGISAFITPDGRIHQATDLFTTDQRSADLPLPLISPTGSRHTDTIYRAGGYLLAPFCLLLLMTGIIRHIYVNIRSW